MSARTPFEPLKVSSNITTTAVTTTTTTLPDTSDTKIPQTPRKLNLESNFQDRSFLDTPSRGSNASNNKQLNLSHLAPKKNSMAAPTMRTSSFSSSENALAKKQGHNSPGRTPMPKFPGIMGNKAARASVLNVQSPSFKSPALPHQAFALSKLNHKAADSSPTKPTITNDNDNNINTSDAFQRSIKANGAHIPTRVKSREPVNGPPARFPLKRPRHTQSLERIAEGDELAGSLSPDEHGFRGPSLARDAEGEEVEDMLHDGEHTIKMGLTDDVFAEGHHQDLAERRQSRSWSRSVDPEQALVQDEEEHDQLEEDQDTQYMHAHPRKKIKLSKTKGRKSEPTYSFREYDDSEASPIKAGSGQRRPKALPNSFTTRTSDQHADQAADDEKENAVNALATLLGSQALDPLLLAECMALYDTESQRWKECTLEEWKDGRQELTQGFTEIMDLVLEHHAQKTQAYTQIDTELENHFKQLEERQETFNKRKEAMLDKAKGFAPGVI